MSAGRRLRVGSYNLEGVWPADERLVVQLKMLAGLELDVVGLQECKWWDRDYLGTLHLAEQILGMRGFLVSSNHHGCHVALFVREAAGIVVLEQRHDRSAVWWHALAHVVVAVEGFAESVHLTCGQLAPSSSALRLVEAEAFKLVVDLPGRLIAVADWNAASAGEPEPPHGDVDLEQVRQRLDRRPRQVLESYGLVDVASAVGDWTPTVGHGGPPRERLAFCCDGIYTSLGEQFITGYGVVWEEDPASDHRPVVATFTLPFENHVGRAR